MRELSGKIPCGRRWREGERANVKHFAGRTSKRAAQLRGLGREFVRRAASSAPSTRCGPVIGPERSSSEGCLLGCRPAIRTRRREDPHPGRATRDRATRSPDGWTEADIPLVDEAVKHLGTQHESGAAPGPKVGMRKSSSRSSACSTTWETAGPDHHHWEQPGLRRADDGSTGSTLNASDTGGGCSARAVRPRDRRRGAQGLSPMAVAHGCAAQPVALDDDPRRPRTAHRRHHPVVGGMRPCRSSRGPR